MNEEPAVADWAPAEAVWGTTRRVLTFLKANPDATASEVATALSLSPQLVHYHLKRLHERSLVISRSGRPRRFRVAGGEASSPGVHPSVENVYVAFIADIVESRKATGRRLLQNEVQETLSELRRTLRADIASDFVITLGDEFQGLLFKPDAAVSAMHFVSETLHPTRLRFGIGLGGLSTELKATAVGMDGPCFHRARNALNEAKESGVWARVSGFGSVIDLTANSLLELLDVIRSDWTETQVRYVRSARKERVKKRVALSLQVSPPAVSEALRAAHFAEVQRAELALGTTLNTSLSTRP